MKIIQNTLKIQKKISNVSKYFWVGPKKVESVGFPETRDFLFGLTHLCNILQFLTAGKMIIFR